MPANRSLWRIQYHLHMVCALHLFDRFVKRTEVRLEVVVLNPHEVATGLGVPGKFYIHAILHQTQEFQELRRRSGCKESESQTCPVQIVLYRNPVLAVIKAYE